MKKPVQVYKHRMFVAVRDEHEEELAPPVLPRVPDMRKHKKRARKVID